MPFALEIASIAVMVGGAVFTYYFGFHEKSLMPWGYRGLGLLMVFSGFLGLAITEILLKLGAAPHEVDHKRKQLKENETNVIVEQWLKGICPKCRGKVSPKDIKCSACNFTL